VKKISLVNLFISFFKINLITFGGGYAIVPIIKKIFVDEKQQLSEEKMMNLIALAQSTPGALAINTSMFLGYEIHGLFGTLVALVGAFLPPLLVISVISMFYQAFQSNPLIQAILLGMRGAVSAIMIVAAFRMTQSLLSMNKVFSILMMTSAILLSLFTHLSVGYLMLMSGFIGFIYFSYLNGEKR
jgi:chromate transporter